MSRKALLALAAASAVAERVTIKSAGEGQFQVHTPAGPLGVKGTVRGAGGWGHLAEAKAYGADAMRTWHISDLPEAIAEAEAHGLRFSSGIWLPHARERYEVMACDDLEADTWWQLEVAKYLVAVRKYKNSSAILWWTVGNEIELGTNPESGTECQWKRLDWVAGKVKAEDPNHPVGFVLAGAHPSKVSSIAKLCKNIDFLGINTYGDASLGVGKALLDAGWTGPYAIMEFGPTGHWESPQTNWDSYIEESSSQKVPRYLATCNSCQADGRCIGAFAFVWGWKWEKTGTWYGMFNEWKAVTENISVPCPKCESETMAAMEQCWTGKRRDNPPPSILAFYVGERELPGMRFSVERGGKVQLKVEATHPTSKPLTAVWAVTQEIVSNAIGGAFEATNPLLPDLWASSNSKNLATGLTAVLDTSKLPSGDSYRLYVFVRERLANGSTAVAKQEASATLPFKICHTAQPGEECHKRVAYHWAAGPNVSTLGIRQEASFNEVQMALHQAGDKTCPMPCSLEEWCHTASHGELCHAYVQYAVREGISKSPELHPGLTSSSTFEDVQMFLHRKGVGLCSRPCAAPGGSKKPKPPAAPTEPTEGDSASGAWRSVPLLALAALCRMLL